MNMISYIYNIVYVINMLYVYYNKLHGLTNQYM